MITEVAEFLNTKKSLASKLTAPLKQNENILTPDLVEGRVATIRFQMQHVPGAIQKQQTNRCVIKYHETNLT
jgi:hypothetical protein